MIPGTHKAIVSELRQRGTGYAVTDTNLLIIATFGDVHLFPECDPASVGLPLTEVVPELVGNESVLAALLAGSAERLQFDVVNRDLDDGREIFVRITELPYRNEDGDQAGIIHFLEDITETAVQQQQTLQQRNELTLLQRTLVQTNKELKSTNEDLSRSQSFLRSFLSVATHQLSEPLNAIDGFFSLLSARNGFSGDTDPRLYEASMQEAIQDLKRAADDLLRILAIGSDDLPLNLRAMELDTLIDEGLAHASADFERKNIRLTIAINDDMPMALCDGEQTVQALKRLFLVAAECAPENGEVSVVLRMDSTQRRILIELQCAETTVTEETLQSIMVLSTDLNRVQVGGSQINALDLHVIHELLSIQNGEMFVGDGDTQNRTITIALPVAD